MSTSQFKETSTPRVYEKKSHLREVTNEAVLVVLKGIQLLLQSFHELEHKTKKLLEPPKNNTNLNVKQIKDKPDLFGPQQRHHQIQRFGSSADDF